MKHIDYQGLNVLLMGLGLHGGGTATARFLVEMGARVTCTDLRNEADLESSILELEGLDVRFVLGGHMEKDFESADLIVKNPGVPSNSTWLCGRHNVETDISLFLNASSSPVLAITGSKGKSTVASALYHILKKQYPGSKLGGNITVSPLSFIHELRPEDPVILELSSWQLADLRGRNLLHPGVCCITNLMHDHQNHYNSLDDYENDKIVIMENIDASDYTIFPDNTYGRRWAELSRGQTLLIGTSEPLSRNFQGAYLDNEHCGWFCFTPKTGTKTEQLLPGKLMVPGDPFRTNLLFASTMARMWGCSSDEILNSVSDFPGVPYRMEMFQEYQGVKYYDDTTATIPNASAAAVKAMDRPVVLIAGGTDKKLDFTPFDTVASIPKRIIMLQGSASETWIPRLGSMGIEVEGPFNDMTCAVKAAQHHAEPGDAILMSPGATSFGMFQHEFQRGDAFKDACRALKKSENLHA